MIKHFSIIAISLVSLLTSCKTNLSEEIVSTHANGMPAKKEFYKESGKNKELIKEVHYFVDGNIQQEGEYQNGKKNGKWIQWYENGVIWSEGIFKDGLREEKTIVYHKNGNLNYTGFYKAGKPDGEWTFYNKNEEKVKIVIYRDGKIIKQEKLAVPFR